MDTNGQLTFDDDPLLQRSNEALELLEQGNFNDAVAIFDQLLDEDPDYPGLVEGYRTARFWLSRQDELFHLGEGQRTADFLMKQWDEFSLYVSEKSMFNSTAYKAIQKYIFYHAAEHYRLAFQKQESPTNNFDLLLNLGVCFLTLKDYHRTIETLEYARSSYQSNAKLLAFLGEAYYQINEKPKSILFFKEAFFINPTEIDLDLIEARPILKLAEKIKKDEKSNLDIREWIPIYAFIEDVFFVRRHLNNQEINNIKKETYSLELNFQNSTADKLETTNTIPRLLNKYIWTFEYYRFQQYNLKNLTEIRMRLTQIYPDLFRNFFQDYSLDK